MAAGLVATRFVKKVPVLDFPKVQPLARALRRRVLGAHREASSLARLCWWVQGEVFDRETPCKRLCGDQRWLAPPKSPTAESAATECVSGAGP
eukprot:770173-Amphidinium_carterae.1